MNSSIFLERIIVKIFSVENLIKTECTDDQKIEGITSSQLDVSVLKRKLGGDLKARIFLVQMKEITTKMILCNLH